MSELCSVPSQSYSRGHDHITIRYHLPGSAQRCYVSFYYWMPCRSVCCFLFWGKLMQSRWWPQWSCSGFPWHPTPSPVPGTGPEVWAYGTDTAGVSRFLFFNDASSRAVTLRDSTTVLQSIIAYYIQQVKPEQCLHHACYYYEAQGKSFKLQSTVGFKDNICSSVFKAACRLLQALTDTFSWVGFKPGLLPKWIKSLSAVLN